MLQDDNWAFIFQISIRVKYDDHIDSPPAQGYSLLLILIDCWYITSVRNWLGINWDIFKNDLILTMSSISNMSSYRMSEKDNLMLYIVR